MTGYEAPELSDHMNGRIYDALLGRFLSADLVVQNPASLQCYNRYSYVSNNPLTMIDRTGFVWDYSGLTADQKKKWEESLKSLVKNAPRAERKQLEAAIKKIETSTDVSVKVSILVKTSSGTAGGGTPPSVGAVAAAAPGSSGALGAIAASPSTPSKADWTGFTEKNPPRYAEKPPEDAEAVTQFAISGGAPGFKKSASATGAETRTLTFDTFTVTARVSADSWYFKTAVDDVDLNRHEKVHVQLARNAAATQTDKLQGTTVEIVSISGSVGNSLAKSLVPFVADLIVKVNVREAQDSAKSVNEDFDRETGHGDGNKTKERDWETKTGVK